MYDLIWGEYRHHGYWHSSADRANICSAAERLIDIITHPLPLSSALNIADIGSGTGSSMSYLKRTHSFTDHSFELTEGTDWLENTLPDDSMDCILAIESTAHFRDTQRAFSEIFRTLKPGGSVAIATWIKAENLNIFERWLIQKITHDGQLHGLLTEHEHLQACKSARLVLTRHIDITQNVTRTWPLITKNAVIKTLTNRKAQKFVLSRIFRKKLYISSAPLIHLAHHLGILRYHIYWHAKNKSLMI